MKLIIGAILENLGTRNDGTVKLSIGTQEIDSAQVGNLFQLRGKFIKVLLSDNNITPLEEKLVDEEQIHGGKKAKTPGQRLRSVMYRVHEVQGVGMDFDDWYKIEMERLISVYKDILNESC